MKFSNRPPINLAQAEIIAKAEQGGGYYEGIGYNRYSVYRGKRYHLVHAYSSGCDFGCGPDSRAEHLGHWSTLEKLAAYLSHELNGHPFPWWASELLEQLGVPAEEG